MTDNFYFLFLAAEIHVILKKMFYMQNYESIHYKNMSKSTILKWRVGLHPNPGGWGCI
jgi:hypothetical protein